MAIEANDVDPLVGGVISSDDQVGPGAGGAPGGGAGGSTAGNDGRAARLQRANVDLN